MAENCSDLRQENLPHKICAKSSYLRRPMPPQRRNTHENAAVRCLRDAQLSRGGVPHLRARRRCDVGTQRQLHLRGRLASSRHGIARRRSNSSCDTSPSPCSTVDIIPWNQYVEVAIRMRCPCLQARYDRQIVRFATAINSLARSVGSDARYLFNEHANVTRDDKDEESNG